MGIDQERLDRAFGIVANAVHEGEMQTAVLAVATGSEVVRCQAFGATVVPGAGVESIYMLASISKAITATAVMTLVDDGLIALSAPVARYVPEFGAGGKDAVTVWHLLTHTSGLVDEGIPWESWRRDRVTAAQIVQSVCATRLEHPPGSRFHYYTGGFFVLAEAITRLTGMDYPDYFRQRVFDPAGMADISFNPWQEGKGQRVIPPVGLTDDGTATSAEVIRYFATLNWPGVALFATAPDLVNLGQTLLLDRTAGRSKILSPAAMELMSREQTRGIAKTEGDLVTPVRYGLTWRKGSIDGRYTLPGSADVIEHDGATGTWLWIDPAWDLVFVLLTNQNWAVMDRIQAKALATVYSAWPHSGPRSNRHAR
ncbi:serine hydrolase domain-containing protein [Microlunatus parietis]